MYTYSMCVCVNIYMYMYMFSLNPVSLTPNALDPKSPSPKPSSPLHGRATAEVETRRVGRRQHGGLKMNPETRNQCPPI